METDENPKRTADASHVLDTCEDGSPACIYLTFRNEATETMWLFIDPKSMKIPCVNSAAHFLDDGNPDAAAQKTGYLEIKARSKVVIRCLLSENPPAKGGAWDSTTFYWSAKCDLTHTYDNGAQRPLPRQAPYCLVNQPEVHGANAVAFAKTINNMDQTIGLRAQQLEVTLDPGYQQVSTASAWCDIESIDISTVKLAVKLKIFNAETHFPGTKIETNACHSSPSDDEYCRFDKEACPSESLKEFTTELGTGHMCFGPAKTCQYGNGITKPTQECSANVDRPEEWRCQPGHYTNNQIVAFQQLSMADACGCFGRGSLSNCHQTRTTPVTPTDTNNCIKDWDTVDSANCKFCALKGNTGFDAMGSRCPDPNKYSHAKCCWKLDANSQPTAIDLDNPVILTLPYAQEISKNCKGSYRFAYDDESSQVVCTKDDKATHFEYIVRLNPQSWWEWFRFYDIWVLIAVPLVFLALHLVSKRFGGSMPHFRRGQENAQNSPVESLNYEETKLLTQST